MTKIEKQKHDIVLVTVVIPYYSNLKWLEEALISVAKQTYLNIETIVINDGSNDDLNRLQKKYGFTLFNQENKGAAAARNVGIKHAKGDYIAFLDSDDIWSNKKIETQLNAMIKYNSVWSATQYSKFYDGFNYIFKNSDSITFKEEYIFSKIVTSYHIATPTIMVKSSFFKSNKVLFDESIRHGEDICLWLELSYRYKLLIINKELSAIRMRKDNASKITLYQLHGRYEICNYINKNCNIKKKIKKTILYNYKLCSIIYVFCLKINNKHLRNTIANILYFGPWLAFKIESISSGEECYVSI